MQTLPLSSDTFDFPHSYLQLDREKVNLLVGDPDQIFDLASVTKPIAAWAVLVAVQRNKISLDDDAGPAGSTVRHLLAHASGVPFDEGNPIAQAGTRRIYSNYGFDLLGDVVANAVGMPIQDWVRHTVVDPLGMDMELNGSIAYSGRSTVDSLGLFATELLNPTLISADLAALATAPIFDGLPGILPGYGKQKNNAFGLGFSVRANKTPHWTGSDFSSKTFGHFGQSGSFIWVDPEVQRAGVFLGAKPFSVEHAAVWPGLTNGMRAV